MRNTDVGIIGAGIVGLATAFALAERGVSVTVYERGIPGNGQSRGEARVFGHFLDDPRLVDFVKRSRLVWDEWAERFGVELISGDGVVVIGPTAERQFGVLQGVGGISARRIDADELHDRLPILADFDGFAGLDERGGSIRTTATISALTAALPDGLVSDEVLLLRPTPAGTVQVQAGGVIAEHGRVVVCAGSGTASLAAGVGLALPIINAAAVRFTYNVRGESPQTLACLQDRSGQFVATETYGASIPGNGQFGIGLRVYMPDAHGGVADPAAWAQAAQQHSAYVERALPGLDPQPVGVMQCWGTGMPWGADGLGVWEVDGILFVAGSNLYKLAPALGRALAAVACGDDLVDELQPGARLGGS